MLKLTSKDGAPARNEAEVAGHPSWGDGGDPMVHGALGWVGGDKLGERCAQEGLENPDQDEAIDDYFE